MQQLVLSVEEAAKALGISAGTCYLLIKEHQLPAVRLGAKRLVVPVVALERFLSQQAADSFNGVGEGEQS